MEIRDGAFPLITSLIGTCDYQEAFTGADICLLIGAFPEKKGCYALTFSKLMQEYSRAKVRQWKSTQREPARPSSLETLLTPMLLFVQPMPQVSLRKTLQL